tara:strand:- start:545 stop:655 length:111 start_codon:yes stop_codon:yes gene_type:complete
VVAVVVQNNQQELVLELVVEQEDIYVQKLMSVEVLL